MDLLVGDLSGCFVAQHSANVALIKLSLIKVSLILLARLIDLICLSSTIGYDLYLVNELIDLAQVHLEESKRILTCCPFNLAYSRHSLGHDGNALAKVWRGGGWIAVDCNFHSIWPQAQSGFGLLQFFSEWRRRLGNDTLNAPFFSCFQAWKEL